MKIDDIFKNADDVTIDRITEKYPVLSEKDKERLYAMSKRKYNINKSTTEFVDDCDVSGVEVYHKPLWRKVVSISAAVLLIAGGAGGTTVLLRNLGGGSPLADVEIDDFSDENETEKSTEELTEIETETETIEESPVEIDYVGIATDLTDRLIELENIMTFRDVAYDENDSIAFYTYSSDDAEWSEKYGGERRFYKVTDERFNSCMDVFNAIKQLMSKELMPTNGFRSATHWETTNKASLQSWIAGDVSIFNDGDRVDLNDENSNKSDVAFRINMSSLIDYNGNLYVGENYNSTDMYFTTDVKITDISENVFTAERYVNPMYTGYENVKYGQKKTYEFVLEDDEWKINSVETGVQVEYESAIAIQCYLEHKEEYYDIDIDCMDILTPLEVIEYDTDDESRCKVHAVLHDINGVDAIDITAEVLLGDRMSVSSADITRLNEYDGTLKRPYIDSIN